MLPFFLAGFTPDPVGPSLADTDAWLQGRLPTAALTGSTGTGSWNVTASYKLSGCTLEIKTTTRILSSEAPSAKVEVLKFVPKPGASFSGSENTDDNGRIQGDSIIGFSDISPSDATIDVESANSTDNLPPIEVAPKLMILTFEHNGLAARVKRAMLHAIQLCGGKPEAF